MQTRKTIVKLTFLLIGILLYLPSYSQENFQPGSITLANGETIQGFIDYREWQSNPDKITFKSSIDRKGVSYSYEDLLGFSVQKEFYVSATFEIETSSTVTNNLDLSREFKTEKKKGFLKSLISGSKSLYLYKDNVAKRNFYIGKDDTFELLLYKKYLINEGTSEMQKADHKKYLEQLAGYFKSCPKVYTTLKNAEYKLKSLEKVFKSYYECTNEEFISRIIKKKPGYSFGVFGGINYSKISFSGNRDYYAEIIDTDFPANINFAGGLSFELIFPRFQKKWSIFNELQYSYLNMSGRYELSGWSTFYQNIDMEFKYSFIKLNNQLRYTHPISEQLALFTNIGFSNGYIHEVKNYKLEENNINWNYTDVTFEGRAIDSEIFKHEKSLLVGIGLKFSRLSIELRYENASDLVKGLSVNSKRNNLYLLIGFRFN